MRDKPVQKPPYELSHREVSLFYGRMFLLNQQFRDLDGIGSSALTDLVTAAPEANAVFVRQIRTDPAHENDILVGGLQGHRVLLIRQVIHQLAAGGIGNGGTNLLYRHRYIKMAGNGNGVKFLQL